MQNYAELSLSYTNHIGYMANHETTNRPDTLVTRDSAAHATQNLDT